MSLSKSSSSQIIIELGENNQYNGAASELTKLATQCLIAAKNGNKLDFSIHLAPTIIKAESSDLFATSNYEEARAKKAHLLKEMMLFLTEPEASSILVKYLTTSSKWKHALSTIFTWSKVGAVTHVGRKYDISRPDLPQINAPIYLTSAEVSKISSHLGLNDNKELWLKLFCISPEDFPSAIIAKHVIPSLIFYSLQYNVPIACDYFELSNWEIGMG